MRTAAVVVALDIADHAMARLGAGRPVAQVVRLVFERGEERLGHGVVMAAAGAPDGEPHVGGGPLGQEPRGVLAAPIGVEGRAARHVAPGARHAQRVHGDAGAHALGERPAHDHACAQVDHDGEEQPPLAGLEVGDVAHELDRGHGVREVAPCEVGTGGRFGVGHGRALGGAGADALYLRLAHQLVHPVGRRFGELRRQAVQDRKGAEPSPGVEPYPLHLGAQARSRVLRRRAPRPGVEAGTRGARHARRQLDRIARPLRGHETVPAHSPCSLAK